MFSHVEVVLHFVKTFAQTGGPVRRTLFSCWDVRIGKRYCFIHHGCTGIIPGSSVTSLATVDSSFA